MMAKSNKADQIKQFYSEEKARRRVNHRPPYSEKMAMSTKPQTTIFREDGYVNKADQARGGPYHNSCK